MHSRNGMGLTFLTFKENVTNLDSMKIRNIFFGDKKFNREGCTAMRPQNRGRLIFLGQTWSARTGRDRLQWVSPHGNNHLLQCQGEKSGK